MGTEAPAVPIPLVFRATALKGKILGWSLDQNEDGKGVRVHDVRKGIARDNGVRSFQFPKFDACHFFFLN